MKKRASLLVIFLVVILTNLVCSMTINVSSPENGKYYDYSSVLFNVTLNENGRCEFSVDSGINNYTMSSIDNLNWNATKSLVDRNYTCHFYCNDTVGSINNTTTSFYVDTLFPNITSQTPANNFIVSKGSVTFSVTYTEANLNYTKLYWKAGDSSYTIENVSSCESGTSKSCSKSVDLSSLSYWENISYFFSLTDKTSKCMNSSVYMFRLCNASWSCTAWSDSSNSCGTRTCTDLNNCGTNEGKPSESQTCSCTPSWGCTSWSDSSNSCGTRTCTDSNSCGTNTDKPSESQSCSETQDTETTNTQENAQNVNYFLSNSQVGNGSLRTLKLVGDKISFKIKNESHVLELRKIFSDKVSIKISSAEQYANLTLNEVKKFDLTADGYYDISVTLKRLNLSEADILLNVTNEKVPITVTTNINVGNTSGGAGNLTSNTASEVGETETANETESFGSRITGGFLGAIENMKQAPIYLLVIFAVVIVGLVGTTIFMILRKKKKKRWGRK